MRVLQDLFDEHLAGAPRMVLKQVLAEKLTASSIPTSEELLESLTDHVLSGSAESFQWDDGSSDGDVHLSITSEDLSALDQKVERFLKSLPEVVEDISSKISKKILAQLKKNWRVERDAQIADISGFRERLEQRWGRGFNLLRMFLTIVRELADDIANDRSSSPGKEVLPDVMLRLHARACLVGAEVLTLLENGYADGAMGRWRTLYELGVVATIISDGGETLATRYIDHRAYEARSDLHQYQLYCTTLGYRPASKRAVQNIEREYTEALRKHGTDFGSQYGWAATYIGKSKPTFRDLEFAAGRAAMRSHYKLGSHNVHAGPHGIFFKLGLLGNSPVLLVGPSNAGFVEPGQNTAWTLMQVTALLFRDKHDLDTVVLLRLLLTLCAEIAKALAQADTKLRREDAKMYRGKATSTPQKAHRAKRRRSSSSRASETP